MVGTGPRTDELALKHLAGDLGVRVRGLRLTHPAMYHLDLAFCPLDERRAMVAPGAFDQASASAFRRRQPCTAPHPASTNPTHVALSASASIL